MFGHKKTSNMISKLISSLALFSVAVVALVGIYDCTNVVMQSQMDVKSDHSMAMADCIPGKNCGMDINQHLNIWQGMLTANFNGGAFNFLAALLALAVIITLYKITTTPTALLSTRYLYYDRHHPDSKLYNYFILVFSNGILQPKLFA